MDVRSWKKVLLQWITKCGFMEKNYFNIEQSDIEEFYQKFSAKHPVTANGKYGTIYEFIQKFYAKVDINLDDENRISSADYIYIYSMFLHFCCVKHPETVFHEICQKLPVETQQYVAAFFNELINESTDSLSKETLRHAIAQVTTANITPPRIDDSITSFTSSGSSGGVGSLPSFGRCISPVKTPKRSAGTQRISPATPKSFLLEERTRELYNLRALLETERYEKGLLELQIKQNEDQIHKLSQDHKKLLQQIQDLKNDVLAKSNESGSVNRDDDEQQHEKRLLKELSHKEEEIRQLNEALRNLKDDKTLVDQKLKYADKQIIICMDKIKELDMKVDELSDELEKKNDNIKYLINSNSELEQFISETRLASTNQSRLDLNVSADCMDGSFTTASNSRNTTNNSAGSTLSSPENLGASVIDIQLREKEHENVQLKQKLANVVSKNQNLAKNLLEITKKEVEEFNIDIDDVLDETLAIDPLEQFNLFTSCIDKINICHKTERNKVQQLEQDSIILRNENNILSNQLKSLSNEIVHLKGNVTSIVNKNQELLEIEKQMKETIQKNENDFNDLQNQKQEILAQLEQTISQNQALNEETLSYKKRFEEASKLNAELSNESAQFKKVSHELESNLVVLREQILSKNMEYEATIKQLNETVEKLSEQLQTHETKESLLKSNAEKLLIENEQLKTEAYDVGQHLSAIKTQLDEKEQQMLKLGEELSNMKEKNVQFEEKINLLIDEYDMNKLNMEADFVEQSKELKKQQQKLEKALEALRESENLMQIKTAACEKLQFSHEQTLAHIESILKLLPNYSELEIDSLQNLKFLESVVKELLEKSKATEVQNEEKLKALQSNSEELQQSLANKLYECENLQHTHADILVKVENIFKLLPNCMLKHDLSDNFNCIETEIAVLMQKSIEFDAHKLENTETILEMTKNIGELQEALSKKIEYCEKLQHSQAEMLSNVQNILKLLPNCEPLQDDNVLNNFTAIESEITALLQKSTELENEKLQNSLTIEELQQALFNKIEYCEKLQHSQSEILSKLQNILKLLPNSQLLHDNVADNCNCIESEIVALIQNHKESEAQNAKIVQKLNKKAEELQQSLDNKLDDLEKLQFIHSEMLSKVQKILELLPNCKLQDDPLLNFQCIESEIAALLQKINKSEAQNIESIQQLIKKSEELQQSLNNKVNDLEKLELSHSEMLSKVQNILELLPNCKSQDDPLFNFQCIESEIAALLQKINESEAQSAQSIQELSKKSEELQQSLNNKVNDLEKLELSHSEMLSKVQKILQLLPNCNSLDDPLLNFQCIESEMTSLLQKINESEAKIATMDIAQLDSCNKLEELEQQCKLSKQSLLKYENEIAKLNAEKHEALAKYSKESQDKEQLLQKQFEESSTEQSNLSLKLKAAEEEISKLKETQIQKQLENSTEQCNLSVKLKTAEEEISQLKQIQAEALKKYKEELNDKSNNLNQLIEENKNKAKELNSLKETIQQKETARLELLKEIKEQTQAAEAQQRLVTQQNEILTELREEIEHLNKDKAKMFANAEECMAQLKNEQEQKSILLNSLEKSADQLRAAADEKTEQTQRLKEQHNELKQQMLELNEQNTKLQGDLIESQAEHKLCQEEQQQEREAFEAKLLESAKKLKQFDTTLVEILAIMENNINFTQENPSENLFQYVAADEQQQQQPIDCSFNKLRQNLNLLLHAQHQLQQQIEQISLQKTEALHMADQCNKTMKQQSKQLSELQKQLEQEELIVQRINSQDLVSLRGDFNNLEKVNERLVNENLKLQQNLSIAEKETESSQNELTKLYEENISLQEDLRIKKLSLERLEKEQAQVQLDLKEQKLLCVQSEEAIKQLKQQLKEQTLCLENLQQQHANCKVTITKNEEQLLTKQSAMASLSAEHEKNTEMLLQLKSHNDSLETELSAKTKDSLSMRNKIDELVQGQTELQQQLLQANTTLDQTIAQKLNAESKCEKLKSEMQQMQRDLNFQQVQQQTATEEHYRLASEIAALKVDKQHLREEIRDTKADLQRANENVTQLIQQISSIRLEKEGVLEENQLLRKQIQDNGVHKSSSETKLKSILDKSQELERKLLSTETELKAMRAHAEKSEAEATKAKSENKRLHETQEANTKRIEKIALKLGDAQARANKLERDNDKLARTIVANSATVEALQKEKEILQNEAKTLKERVSKAERAHEQLAAKVNNLEYANTSLQETKHKLEANEFDVKTKLNKFEKMRNNNDDKIRKLSSALNTAESANVKLNLEIGALHAQLQEARNAGGTATQEQNQQIRELNRQLEAAKEQSKSYETVLANQKKLIEQLKEENSTLQDQLSKSNLSLDITKQKCEKMSIAVQQIRIEMLNIREQKMQIEVQHENLSAKLKDMEAQNELSDRNNVIEMLESKITMFEQNLCSKTNQVEELQQEIQQIRESSELQSATVLQQSTNISEMEDLRTKLSEVDDALQKEQQIVNQLRMDNQILHTKYQESKQKALDAVKLSEDKIKENRLELEGKLEKMKSKMKTLYTEEITKMKIKQEREMAVFKSDMEVLKTQNIKYEEHTRKLSSQIVRLNDNILQHQKENTILSTKLKHFLEQHENDKFKRPSSIHVSSSAGSSASTNLGTNLAMEDEEGEIFNNTYLTDLKSGRMSEYMSREVCVEELQHRNSMLPPHLRSTYAAQYEHEIDENDLKDGPHSFDDSMSALLSTTSGGSRKKCTGVTHYKKPGPPTPSKNGRLSFGGLSSEPAREILKESFDSNTAGGNALVTSSKTPARFTSFVSRFSMGNNATRDENSPLPNPKRRLSSIFKRK